MAKLKNKSFKNKLNKFKNRIQNNSIDNELLDLINFGVFFISMIVLFSNIITHNIYHFSTYIASLIISFQLGRLYQIIKIS